MARRSLSACQPSSEVIFADEATSTAGSPARRGPSFTVTFLPLTSSTVRIFGDDYPTPDGTCVRDYIHVTDLADAHLRALAACRPGQHRIYNLGNGAGFSVREVIEVCREVTGTGIGVDVVPRRAGDPAVLVASSEKIQSGLGWRASRDLRAMVADAWRFTQARNSR